MINVIKRFLKKLRFFYQQVFEVLHKEYGSKLIYIFFVTILIVWINFLLNNYFEPYGKYLGMFNYLVFLCLICVYGIIFLNKDEQY